MNNKCLFCNNILPQSRKKYCSTICIKRAWYLRNNPNCKSHLNKNPNFWKTETGIGYKWEKYVAKKLGAEHIKFGGHREDVNLNGIKIDVKACELYKRKFARGKPVKRICGQWIFNRNSIKPMDYFYCVCLVKGKPVKELYIPADKFGLKGITVCKKSKYDIYKV